MPDVRGHKFALLVLDEMQEQKDDGLTQALHADTPYHFTRYSGRFVGIGTRAPWPRARTVRRNTSAARWPVWVHTYPVTFLHGVTEPPHDQAWHQLTFAARGHLKIITTGRATSRIGARPPHARAGAPTGSPSW